jgi:hypothetical protein
VELHRPIAIALLGLSLACAAAPRTVAPAAAQTDEALETRRQVAIAGQVLCPPGDLECQQLASQERIAAEERQEMRNEGDETRKMLEGQHNERLQLEREKELEGAWFCFEGEAAGQPAGACRKNQDECIDAATRAVAAGLGGDDVGCHRQANVICYGAVRALDGERIVRCFPSASSCERHHAQLVGRAGWSELSECMPLR